MVPAGDPLGPNDEGGLKCGITHIAGRVVINLGKKIDWFAMTPDEADEFAAKLKEWAAKARAKR